MAVLFGMLGRPFLTLFASHCGVEGSSRGTTRFAFSRSWSETAYGYRVFDAQLRAPGQFLLVLGLFFLTGLEKTRLPAPRAAATIVISSVPAPGGPGVVLGGLGVVSGRPLRIAVLIICVS